MTETISYILRRNDDALKAVAKTLKKQKTIYTISTFCTIAMLSILSDHNREMSDMRYKILDLEKEIKELKNMKGD